MLGNSNTLDELKEKLKDATILFEEIKKRKIEIEKEIKKLSERNKLSERDQDPNLFNDK